MVDFIQHIYFSILETLHGTYTLQILTNFFELVWTIAPYFIIAVFIHVGLNYLIRRKKVSLTIRNEYLGIVAAALLGALSPLPTYAAVPIALSFIGSGLRLSVAMSFLIASPLINPSIFFLTASLLGLRIALVRLFLSIFIAIIGGIALKLIRLHVELSKSIATKKEGDRTIFVDVYRTTLFLGKYFVIALLLSAAVRALLPADYISRLLGQNVSMSLLVAIALGVPFYSCGGAAIPLIEVLMEKGMSDAAVIAFFIAGPATKLETVYIYRSMLGSKILIFYLILTCFGAYLGGVMMYYLF